MFTEEALDVQPYTQELARLPFSILLCLPEYVTSNPGAPRFHLPGAIGRLIGKAGYARAVRVLEPYIWAPGWTDAELELFVNSPFQDRPELFKGVHPATLRVLEFISASTSGWVYDIVHYTGFVEWRGGGFSLILGRESPGEIRAGALLDALMSVRARLLLLQVPKHQLDQSYELAKVIVGGGGPAVLVVTGRDWGTVDKYLLGIYANILHNSFIPDLAKPEPFLDYQQLTVQDTTEPRSDALNVRIIYSNKGRELLRLDRYVLSLRERFANARGRVLGMSDELGRIRQGSESYLHKSQLQTLTNFGFLSGVDFPTTTEQVTRLDQISWNHESEGAIPSSEVEDSIVVLESQANWLDELCGKALHPQRVLNACFREVDGSLAVNPSNGLIPSRDYDLRVDVGSRKSDSIVTGNGAFPENALPPRPEGGWRIQVVFVSNDFSPSVTSAFLWVPYSGGSSFPDVDGHRAEESGPVSLHVRTPRFPSTTTLLEARLRGRLCLYYENNLLQSAAVNVGLIRSGESKLSEPSTINVDFSLTSNFLNLKSRFASRDIGVDGANAGKVALSLTLNDDGGGQHRIVIKDHPEIEPAFALYDPGDATHALVNARKALLKCFDGLSEANGKSREEFRGDLYRLAKCGRELFSQAFSGVKLSKRGMRPAEWEAQLRQVLASGNDVIQVARTGPAQYIFPWTLVYEYPFTGLEKDWRTCNVIKEQWSEEGVRFKGLDAKSCPFKQESYHQANIICPYGFWGLKQIIEQPLSALSYTNGQMELGEAPDEVRFRESIEFAVGVSDDLEPEDPAHTMRDRHLCKLAQISPIQLNPTSPANDFYKVRDMLRSPVIAYFICHGEYDPQKRTTYLSVGLRDNSDKHKIYPSSVRDWASGLLLNIASWKEHRPLIFINGCHTVDLTPGEVSNFVTSFADAGAGGIVGTEINVKLQLAAEVAESLLGKLARGNPIGAAMQQIRWDLANKGNLLGLAYTANCMADLKIVREF